MSMKDKLDMYILNSLMDGSMMIEYIWDAVNKRKNEDYKIGGARLEKGEDVDYSRALVLHRTLGLWLIDGFLYPYDAEKRGDRYVAVTISDIEFSKIHDYEFELTDNGRAEVDKREYEPYWKEIRDDD